MQLHRAILTGVAVVAIVVIVAYLRHPSPESGARDTGDAENHLRSPVAPARSRVAGADDVSALREELASVRAELLQLRRERIGRSGSFVGNGQQSQPEPRNAAESNGESGADPRRSAMAREEESRIIQARIASIDASFRREVIDPTWSTNTASRIMSVFGSDEMDNLQADGVDCRSDICRVELHGDSRRLNRKMPMLAMQLAGALPNIIANSVVRPDGGVSMVLYLSRQSQGAPPVRR